MALMEKELAELSLDKEEVEGLQFAFEVTLQKPMYDLCLIGLLSHIKNTMVDVERVMIGTPWTFNNHLLLLHRLKEDDDPNLMPLVFSNFWVQVYELSTRFFSDHVAQQLGDFVGKFLENLLEHDTKQLNQGFRNFMCISV
ncbi:hypothetical protein Godav_027855 [Gossypium davidsonii]|uniref:DUF4283 domain-containing protein n=1 Tax=Gossypium davidsonii TaxID=34287 RepID=A0A7J8RXZ3_GOSDV|nr:hypothetical protein [Gossypium davidsonii]